MQANRNSPAGIVHWIDHYVVSTNDVPRWRDFHCKVLGAETFSDPNPRTFLVFITFGNTRIGAIDNVDPLPTTLGLGEGMPRFGLYVDQADIDAHLRRLDEAGALHGPATRVSAHGDSGISIAWQDPDGNQFEFWAPDAMPAGAMVNCSPARVGRISHAVLESRDLERTADFFRRYCGLEPIPGAQTGVLAMRLGAGGRLIFHEVTKLGGRTTGCGLRDTHTALLVHVDDYIPNYRRLWADLPEWDYNPVERKLVENPSDLPARTVVHATAAGLKLKAFSGRGDDFLDWDTNSYHFYGGIPSDGTSMAVYKGCSTEYYLPTFERMQEQLVTAHAVV
jgi:catechol 2,3-dioxygenase-like lactoylglutathione lyase family enzyme